MQEEATASFQSSPQQEQLWLREPDGPSGRNQLVFALEGAIDADRLRDAVAQAVARHEILRTTFQRRSGMRVPLQVVHEQLAPGWSVVAAGDDAGVADLAREDRAAAVSFDGGPVLRATLVRVDDARGALILTLPSAFADGTSLATLAEEIAQGYAGEDAGEEPLQYADFAAWQHERLGSPEIQARLAFWRERLAGAPRILALPLDRPRPEQPSYRGDRIDGLLPAGLLARLNALATAEGASFYMVLLAALALLLGERSGQAEVVVGSPGAGRGLRETEELIGVFLNVLPMRVDLSGGPTFRALVRRARRISLEAYAEQEYPFERLLPELGIERQPSHTPLFQVQLNVLNLPPVLGELPGDVQVEPLAGQRIHQFKYDLIVEATETGEGLALMLLYALDLFDRPRMQALFDDLVAVLAGAADDPDRTAAALVPRVSP
jgi:Condensation domain